MSEEEAKTTLDDIDDLGLGDETTQAQASADDPADPTQPEQPPELGEAVAPKPRETRRTGPNFFQTIPRAMYMEGVEVGDLEILEMPLSDIKDDIGLVRRLIAEINRMNHALAHVKSQVVESLGVLGKFSEYTSKLEGRLLGPNAAAQNVRTYIERQNEARFLKSQRAANFLQGVPFNDIAKHIDPRSKLDQVMGAKRGRGSDAFRKPHPVKTGG